jgi:hypothetical protein
MEIQWHGLLLISEVIRPKHMLEKRLLISVPCDPFASPAELGDRVDMGIARR